MKVYELISNLQLCDPNAWVIAHEEGNPYPVNVVTKINMQGNSFNPRLSDESVSVVYLDLDPEVEIESFVEKE